MVRKHILPILISFAASSLILVGCNNGGDLNSAWKAALSEEAPEDVVINDPEQSTIVKTSDKSVFVFAKGDGVIAAFNEVKGQYNLIARTYGAFDSMFYTDDNFIILEQRSPVSDDIFVKKYFHVVNGEVEYVVSHEKYFVDNSHRATNVVFSYAHKGEYPVSLSEIECLPLLPKGESTDILTIF